MTEETRTVYDPFAGKNVQISDRLVDRLRGKYASGPHLPNGNPEFGWKQFQATPINLEAAKRIEELEAALSETYGHVLEGSSTIISRNNMLHKIRTALRWPDAEVAARRAVDALQKWAAK